MIEKICTITAVATVRYGDSFARRTVKNETKIPIIACVSTEAELL